MIYFAKKVKMMMKITNLTRLKNGACAVICSAALCATLTGCSMMSTAGTNTNTSQSDNRTYMSQVNTIMSELGDDLEDFTDAVSRGDKVSMKTQCDKALKQLDDLDKLEASEDMAEVKTKYSEGVTKLKAALTEYVDAYTSGDVSAEVIADIQTQYDAGVAALSSADSLAASKS